MGFQALFVLYLIFIIVNNYNLFDASDKLFIQSVITFKKLKTFMEVRQSCSFLLEQEWLEYERHHLHFSEKFLLNITKFQDKKHKQVKCFSKIHCFTYITSALIDTSKLICFPLYPLSYTRTFLREAAVGITTSLSFGALGTAF